MTIQLWAIPFAYGTIVRSEFLSYVRAALPSAVDGVGGGDYQPLTPIRFGDAGISMYGNAPMTVESGSTVTWQSGSSLVTEAGATVTFGGDVDVSAGDVSCVNLDASGTIDAGGLLTCNGGLLISDGETLTVDSLGVVNVGGEMNWITGSTFDVDATVLPVFNGNVLIVGDLEVSDVIVNNSVEINDDLDVLGVTTLDDVGIVGDLALTGDMTTSLGFTSTNGVEHRQTTIDSNDIVISTNSHDTIFIEDPVPPGAGTVVISNALSNPSPRVRFTSLVAHVDTVTIRSADAVDLVTFSSGGFSWADLEWNGTTWAVVAWGGNAVRLV